MHILEKIVRYKKEEIAVAKAKCRLSDLEKTSNFQRSCNSYVDTIDNNIDNSGVIAEFKRKSPSRSDINLTADLASVTQGYVDGGANAISILTDEHFFGGSNQFLTSTREKLPTTPLLRKEFIIDEYQIVEAKALGADIILLICEILTAQEVDRFASLARSLGMEVLLEMHSSDQIKKYSPHVSMVGVNNRDLKSFEVDYDRSKKLFDKLPIEVPKIAESGLSKTSTCAMLYNYGFRGFLIGEHFMKQDSPGAACGSFINDFMSQRKAK